MTDFSKQFSDFDVNFNVIAQEKCVDEATVVNQLLQEAALSKRDTSAIARRAKAIVEALRAKAVGEEGVSAMLLQYGLSTEEGTALMCLAEAMLRVPDNKTIDQLIHDKIGTLDWKQHTGKSPSLFVNAATWGLVLTGKVIAKPDDEQSFHKVFSKLVKRVGEPIIRKSVKQAMQILGQQFVMGRTISEAVKKGQVGEQKRYGYSYDMLGEAAHTLQDAERYFVEYANAIEALSDANSTLALAQRPGISIKLSALYPRYQVSQRQQALPILQEKLLHLVLLAKQGNISVTVDAEEADRLELSLQIFKAVFCHQDLADWSGFGLAVQSYQKRAPQVVDWLIALARSQQKRIMVRLIKGAYWDTEIKYAQQMGYPGYPVFTRKPSTDVCYLVCAKRLLAASDVIYPQFATHNALTVATLCHLVGKRRDFEFQCLHGMGRGMYDDLVTKKGGGYACRIYAPVGGYQDLLPYLVRRLLENGANSSFVNRIADPEVPIEQIIADPVHTIEHLQHKPHPDIPLPRHLYPHNRLNSSGVDLTDQQVLVKLAKTMDAVDLNMGTVGAMLAHPVSNTSATEDITNPADRRIKLGKLRQTSANEREAALQTAHEATVMWDSTPVEARAEYLLRAADLLEQRMSDYMVMVNQEAGKSWEDGVDEVREAVDFMRYYAEQAVLHLGQRIMPGPTGESNILSTHGRGVMLCISPWNFPLAIFLGQISAALVAGNTVVAKPASQTVMTATMMVRLLYEIGLPREVLQLLPGGAKTVGQPLVSDPRVAGVMLTGSTFTGKAIQRALAQREGPIAPLIAETGGQNAMIVDSTALPEQVAMDVIESAFKSAGQRCSALRVLFLQEEVADKIITMLQGAMSLLHVGDPALLATDVGPVIDQDALKRLQDHLVFLDKISAKHIYTCKLDASSKHGTFFPPCAYEIDSIAQLSGEVFGPVLHIVRYKKSELDEIIADINQTQFGLTLGIQSRIVETVEAIVSKVHVGNIYVNRNMIGAVVGVQPFGGEGLSGTGPKAGGPHYLSRLVIERTISNNIAAVGGNTTLMSLSQEDDTTGPGKDVL